MNDIKKFARGLVIPVLIGLAIGIFTSRVIRPVFDLGQLETIVTTVAVASGACAIFLFIKTRKKK